MANQLLLYLCILSLCSHGCFTLKSEKILESNILEPSQQETPPVIATLGLSTNKTVFKANEPILLEMAIRVGKFHLLVPYSSVKGNGAFTGLIVKNATGKTVHPEIIIAMAAHTKTLIRDGKAVNCIQGTNLAAGTSSVAVLEDLRTHYELVSGKYTVQVFMNLNVYREVLEDQSAQIVEMQKDIASIKASRHSDEAKQEAIARLSEDIAAIQREQEGSLTSSYLPLDSRRGAMNLDSNIVRIKIE